MNLLRIHSISILTLLAICVLTNGSPIKDTKDSRVVRIKPSPIEEKQPRVLHETDAQVRTHDPNKINPSGNKKAYVSNRQLLTKLGLSKLRIPASHSRKRLAVESRHHARPDDSHMFVIKLPPNPYYYTNPNANAVTKTAYPAASPQQTAVAPSQNVIHDNNFHGSARTKKVSSFGFQLNGKPGRIYHWNLPIIKKLITGEGRSKHTPKNDVDVAELIDMKNTPTWSKPWENDTAEKSYSKYGAADTKSFKRKSPTYYAPVKSKKNNIHNYFPGNGKPKGFYVIQQNKKSSHKPSTYYRKLIY